MGYKIDEIEGIGPVNKEKLAAAGIATTDDLLQLCASAKGRQETSEKVGVSASQLLKWADMADLMRISGVGRQFGELLKAITRFRERSEAKSIETSSGLRPSTTDKCIVCRVVQG